MPFSKKNKKSGNKSKEVLFWDDMPDSKENPKNMNTGKWVLGSIPMSEIKKMKWGDVDDLTDEEFGFYKM